MLRSLKKPINLIKEGWTCWMIIQENHIKGWFESVAVHETKTGPNKICLKPLYTFGSERTKKFTDLQIIDRVYSKVMVKDFSWNIVPWNALLFEKVIILILVSENYGFISNTCHDTAKHAETRVGFPVVFSRLWWPIEPKFSQVCYFLFKLWYTKCGTWTILFTESV